MSNGATDMRLEVRDVTKTFPGVRALDRVSLGVGRGEIHALLGENGAGKSTLSKIVSGIYAADRGEIVLDGRKLSRLTEAEAGRIGIGVVHQEGSLVAQLSVGENIFAGRQPTKWLNMVDRGTMHRRAKALLDRLGVDIDPAELVQNVSPAQRQVIEIAKALSRDLRVLILDEPTAALTLNETHALFRVARQLAAEGVSIIYVSHRLAEIFELCDRVTVLKDGRWVDTLDVADTDTDELIRLMVGRELHFQRDTSARSFGEVVLEARNISSGVAVRDASLSVRRGEIVCLAGLVGAGRTELCEAIFGARHYSAGDIALLGKPFRPRSPRHAIGEGIAMVCEDRKESGLFLDRSLVDNIVVTVLGDVANGVEISAAKSKALAASFVDALDIATPSVRQVVGNLSGGNQQKVLLAKWLAVRPDLLIVDEPTRGVDAGARTEIYKILRQRAADGVALIVISSDLPEVLTLADRIVVMAEGRTTGELPGDTADEVSIMNLATRSQTSRNDFTRAV